MRALNEGGYDIGLCDLGLYDTGSTWPSAEVSAFRDADACKVDNSSTDNDS